uniref:Jacalin-type lectin domain-containing protein n=1 Tax=Oryza brachyantha TaxID=4533 RepID=J3L3C0_ORYBR
MQPAYHYQRRMVASSKTIKVGPWGGAAGSPWDDGAHRGVRRIILTYGRFLESMRVEYDDRSGRPVLGEKHGGGSGGDGRAGGSRTAEVKLDYPYEFLTGVKGRMGPVAHGSPVIRSLTFRTSKGAVHGPFGDPVPPGDGVPFEYPMERGVVVGFSGRSGWWHLDAIGLYVAALRAETLCDVVQERGAMAYRSVVYGNGGSGAQLQRRKPFEWCYK